MLRHSKKESRLTEKAPIVDGLEPTSDAEAVLLEKYPIQKPKSDRRFEVRDGRVVEIVSDAAFVAIKRYLSGEDAEAINASGDEAAE